MESFKRKPGNEDNISRDLLADHLFGHRKFRNHARSPTDNHIISLRVVGRLAGLKLLKPMLITLIHLILIAEFRAGLANPMALKMLNFGRRRKVLKTYDLFPRH